MRRVSGSGQPRASRHASRHCRRSSMLTVRSAPSVLRHAAPSPQSDVERRRETSRDAV